MDLDRFYFTVTQVVLGTQHSAETFNVWRFLGGLDARSWKGWVGQLHGLGLVARCRLAVNFFVLRDKWGGRALESCGASFICFVPELWS